MPERPDVESPAIESPEGAPPRGAPPKGAPPKGAAPEGAPPEGAPPSRTALDRRRRTWLIATSVLGGAGGVAAVAPLIGSLGPSARVRASAAPLEVDLGTLAPGQVVTVAWRGRPVWILNRTAAMLAEVDAATPRCADPHSLRPYTMPLPEYCRNGYRARAEHPNIAVLVGVCTHLGCTPVPRFAAGAQPNLPADWPGGWLCPCHGSTFDLAGRVFRNQPAPQNLDVPRYSFLSPARLVIGRDEHGEA
ncbi:ubiquinol-cytochrome c reductase iron-sulfur subunit [Robbsia sp. Bb-Pol-6]|uniref:Ubiquinol-cytochrome c reductase iron-sulfur subunit n=1 Tax=Robbsia betulipollinis TaxID=2981849 RepID=A0ABT3ZP86_9BURK|nr:ubiquinol-cytochrome c reductase iron-sulfur subunit [Robbsia betulipollinis]MCY0388366.1 ubiquinol-cytochrome c reductase iron-sulfur subunit [Robbsia betulipollinis]